jgi:PAS domain S-box-containing protein
MLRLADLPFRHRLTAAMTATAALAVGLGLSTLIAYQFLESRKALEDDLAGLARIVGTSSVAALTFDDRDAANETLQTLRLRPYVVAACLFRSEEPFAVYRRSGPSGGPLPTRPGAAGVSLSGEFAEVFDPVMLDRGAVGHVYLRVDATPLWARIRAYAVVAGLVLLACTLAALALSRRLEWRITAPLLRLSAAAERVASGREYSLRVPEEGQDELTALTRVFNEMLAQVEQRNDALRASHDDLERRVAERTARIEAARQELEREVAERRRAEGETLRLAAAVEQAGDGIVITDADGAIQYVNPAFTAMSGYDREEVLGQTPRVLKSGELPPELYEQLWQTLLAGQTWRGELVNRRKDGRLYTEHMTATAVRGSDGKATHFVAIKQDVTERRRVEQELLRTQYAVDHSPDAVLWVGEDGRLLYANEAACRSTGHPREELLTMRFTDVDPDIPAEAFAGEWQALREAGSRTFETRRRRRDGSVFPIEIAMNFVAFGGREYLCTFARDVTARHQLEEQFRQAQKMDAVGRLAGGVAHDFNNLLGVIHGYSELLLRRLDPSGGDRNKAEQILRAAERAARLTGQLLTFSRKQVVEMRVIDLAALVAEMVPMLARLIGEDVDLQVDRAPEVARVRADAGQLEQVVMNLAVNARDAMPRGGSLRIELRNVDLDEAYARVHLVARAGPHVMLAVADSGIGMDAATLSHLFEPFFTTKEKGKGTGLGLATVYGIVQQGGGHITVESDLGRGTTFRVYLPAVDIAAAEASLAPSSSASGGVETILLVEDEEALLSLVRELLEGAGYTVLAARDGPAALALARDPLRSFDLVLSDVIMPGLSGPELVGLIRRGRPRARVLFMSGYTDDAMVARDIPAGTRLLQKPFGEAALLRAVREVLGRGPERDEAEGTPTLDAWGRPGDREP